MLCALACPLALPLSHPPFRFHPTTIDPPPRVPLMMQIAEDSFAEVAAAVLAAYDSGDLAAAVAAEGGFKKWANALGKAQKRKGKRLFMPLRIALTVRGDMGGG